MRQHRYNCAQRSRGKFFNKIKGRRHRNLQDLRIAKSCDDENLPCTVKRSSSSGNAFLRTRFSPQTTRIATDLRLLPQAKSSRPAQRLPRATPNRGNAQTTLCNVVHLAALARTQTSRALCQPTPAASNAAPRQHADKSPRRCTLCRARKPRSARKIFAISPQLVHNMGVLLHKIVWISVQNSEYR